MISKQTRLDLGDPLLEFGNEIGDALVELQSKRESLSVENKSQTSFQDLVTEADLTIDQKLHDGLPTIFDAPYVSEESGDKSLLESHESPFWLADPIDGTNNFINGMPMFGTAIALIDAGQPVVSLSVCPRLQQTYLGIRDGGAWCNGRALKTQANDPNTWIAEVSSQPHDAELLRNAMLMISRTRAVRIIGSIALSLAWVAAGHLDLFIGRGYAWDVAAGMLLLDEAGGKAIDLSGSPRDPLKFDMMVSGHPEHVAYALERISPGSHRYK